MTNFLQPATLLKNLVLHNLFSKVSDNCILRTFPHKNQKVSIMLTFMNSKLTKIAGKYKQNHSKKINRMKYPVYMYCIYIYIYIGKDWEFIIHVFYWSIPLDYEICTKCKKTSNLIKGIFSHNICSGIKSEQIKKAFIIQNQRLLIFLRIPLLHFIELLLTIQFHAHF